MLNSCVKDRENTVVQLFCSLFRDTPNRSSRVNARGKKRFISVDVPNSANECLVEQKRLNQPAVLLQARVKLFKAHLQRIGADPFQGIGHLRKELYAAKLANVIIEQGSGIQVKGGPRVFTRQTIPEKLACHPQVNVKNAPIKIEEDLLSAPANIPYYQPAKRGRRLSQTSTSNSNRKQLNIQNGSPERVRSNGANDGFNFGQFRHRSSGQMDEPISVGRNRGQHTALQ